MDRKSSRDGTTDADSGSASAALTPHPPNEPASAPVIEDIPSEPIIYNNKELRIVLVGKTGAGKSATGNIILGKKHFKSMFSFKSFTKQCDKARGEVDGQQVAVIDTPGLFDTTVAADKTKTDVVQCVSYASPGPHIFLVVIKLGRFTEEEKKTVEIIQHVFGKEADKYSMVLFTHGDQLEEEKNIKELLEESEDLQELVAKCNGQYHVFNNELEDRSQVSELLNKIRDITEKNGGSHYTTEMFQEAERVIEEEKQRILKETKEQRLKEQKELEDDVERQREIMAECEREKEQAERKLKEMEQKQKELLAKREREKKEENINLDEVQEKEARSAAEDMALRVAIGFSVVSVGAAGSATLARAGGAAARKAAPVAAAARKAAACIVM